MSVALYIALERNLPGFDASSVWGTYLATTQRRLDGIAREQGLMPLEDFISVDPEDAMTFLEGEGGVPEGLVWLLDLLRLPTEQFGPAYQEHNRRRGVGGDQL